MDFLFSLSDAVTIAATGETGQITYLQETVHGPQYEITREDGTTVMVPEDGLASA